MKVPLQKRLFDLACCILTSPVWLSALLASVVLQLLLEGRPVFYTSTRRVYREQQARIVKLRTMRRDADKIYNRQTVPMSRHRFLNIPIDSPLYTPLGRCIERCQFTELPQVLQVISGVLSIVGNRPLPENVIAALKKVHANTEQRFLTPGGLTGLVQLIGRECLSDAERLALEIRYCHFVLERYAMRMDFLILLYTVLVHLRLRRAFTVESGHRFLDGFGPRMFEAVAAPITSAEADCGLKK